MNYRVRDLTGQRFGRLVMLRFQDSIARKARWLAKCDCGRETVVVGINAVRGNTRSCGCLAAESLAARAVVHGHARVAKKSAEYRTWCDMRTRCKNPRNKFYPAYGAVGITVCPRWDSFEAFFEDMGTKPTPLHTIDRKNNARGYEPENCRWATRKEQTRNRSCVRLVDCGGVEMTVLEASERTGVAYGVLADRFHRGVTGEALFKPTAYSRATRVVVYEGQPMSLPEASKLSGLPLSTLQNRYKRGWPADRLFAPIRSGL